MRRPKFLPNWKDVTAQKIGTICGIVGAETFRKERCMNDETAATQGLELCYLGRLTEGGDLALIYAPERFLAYDKGPSRVKDSAKNAVAAVLSIRGVFPDDGARLAVFHLGQIPWRQQCPGISGLVPICELSRAMAYASPQLSRIFCRKDE
jgi:hypothetical protein